MAEVKVFPDIAQLAQAVADEFINIGNRVYKSKNRFSVALAGGSTPRAVYKLLAKKREVDFDWSLVHFFWGDERCVHPGLPDSNYKMAYETLISHIPVPESNIHRMMGELKPSLAAEKYQQELKSFFDDLPDFNLVILGMGSDGHTASLFPGDDAIFDNERWVTESYIPKLDAWRITLTPLIINQAEHVIFMVSGQNKALALKHVLKGPYKPKNLPAQVIQPKSGSLTWMVDQQAAGALNLE